MFVLVSKDKLKLFLQEELKCWKEIGGGPNPYAYEFDPSTTDPEKLKELGYYSNREAWIAGVRVHTVEEFLQDLDNYPTTTLDS